MNRFVMVVFMLVIFLIGELARRTGTTTGAFLGAVAIFAMGTCLVKIEIDEQEKLDASERDRRRYAVMAIGMLVICVFFGSVASNLGLGRWAKLVGIFASTVAMLVASRRIQRMLQE